MATDDKTRQTLAIVLCLVVALVYSEYVLKPQTLRQQQAIQQVEQSKTSQTATTVTQVPTTTTTPVALQNTTGQTAPVTALKIPSLSEYQASPVIKIETDKAFIQLSTLGGRLLSLQLKDYKKELAGEELFNMVQLSDTVAPPLGISLGGLSDANTNYQIASSTHGMEAGANAFRLTDAQELILVLTGTLSNGQSIEKRLIFSANSYRIKFQASSAPSADGSAMILEWTDSTPNQSNATQHEQKEYMTLGQDNKIAHILFSHVTTNFTSVNSKWLSFNDTYFSTVLIPQKHPSQMRYRKLDDRHFVHQVLGEPANVFVDLYVGPKEQRSLELAGHDLYRSIDLGWFSFLAVPMMELLRLFYRIFGNYGLAIVLLTLLIKISFYALTKKQMASVKSMQQIQPEVQALRERIKDSAQLNQEMLALYKKRGINPMAGCFPILVQIPFFVGLYNVLYNAIELRHSPFALWITDLSKQESLLLPGLPFGIPVMVIVMGLLMFYQQKKTPTPGMDPVQRKIMLVMPVIFTVMFIPFPAGLVLYWLINQIMSLVQQNHLVSGKVFGGVIGSPFVGTLVASAIIFGVCFILTLL